MKTLIILAFIGLFPLSSFAVDRVTLIQEQITALQAQVKFYDDSAATRLDLLRAALAKAQATPAPLGFLPKKK